jgi:hypothetical protein
MWPHGTLDIQAVASITYGSSSERKAAISNGHLALSYLIKYLLKNIDSPENRLQYDITFEHFALLWATHRRAFSLTKKFNERLREMAEEKVVDLITIRTEKISKTAKSVKSKKLIWIGTKHYDPLKNPDIYDRWRLDYLENNFAFADPDSHLSRYRAVSEKLRIDEEKRNRPVSSFSAAARLQKSRILTAELACDVWNGINPHTEIPYSYEWR